MSLTFMARFDMVAELMAIHGHRFRLPSVACGGRPCGVAAFLLLMSLPLSWTSTWCTTTTTLTMSPAAAGRQPALYAYVHSSYHARETISGVASGDPPKLPEMASHPGDQIAAPGDPLRAAVWPSLGTSVPKPSPAVAAGDPLQLRPGAAPAGNFPGGAPSVPELAVGDPPQQLTEPAPATYIGGYTHIYTKVVESVVRTMLTAMGLQTTITDSMVAVDTNFQPAVATVLATAPWVWRTAPLQMHATAHQLDQAYVENYRTNNTNTTGNNDQTEKTPTSKKTHKTQKNKTPKETKQINTFN